MGWHLLDNMKAFAFISEIAFIVYYVELGMAFEKKKKITYGQKLTNRSNLLTYRKIFLFCLYVLLFINNFSYFLVKLCTLICDLPFEVTETLFKKYYVM